MSVVRLFSPEAPLRSPELRQVLDLCPAGMVIFQNPDLMITAMNRAAEAHLGRQADVLGKRLLDVEPAYAGSELLAALEAVGQTGESRLLKRFQAPGGRVYRVEVLQAPFGLTAWFHDVTLLAQREAQQAALSSLGLRALSGASLEQVDDLAVELVRSALSLDVCAVDELQPGGGMVRVTSMAGNGPCIKGSQHAADEMLGGAALRSQAPLMMNSARDEQRFPAARLLSMGFQSGLAAPIHAPGGPVGVLVGLSRAPRTFRQEDLDFLQNVAHVLAALRGRVQAEAQAQQARARLAQVLEVLPTTVGLFDERGATEYLNPAALAVSGRTLEESRGRFIVDSPLFQGPRLKDWLSGALQRLSEGRPVRDTAVLTRPNGATVTMDFQFIPLHGADGRITQFVVTGNDVTERDAATAALKRSEELFRALAEHSSEMISIVRADGIISYMSNSSRRMIGMDPARITGQPLTALIHPDDLPRVQQVFAEILATPGEWRSVEYRLAHANGSWRVVEMVGHNCLNHPAIGGIVGNTRDVTDKRRAQEMLQQTQKMDAVGQLAGGIAHDFNNILTTIKSYSQMGTERLLHGDPMRADLEEIDQAADRAASLTHQLLAFGRRQVMQPRTLALGAVVLDMEKMLRRIIGEDVTLDVRLAPAPLYVHADRGQLEQVIVNLAVNARDAMPGGGRLTLVIDRLEEKTRGPGPGAYVRLRATDTGIGMSPEVLSRAFEPFFTTKPAGKGTGLGLATVYGIVQQSGGSVSVESEQGLGTTFQILLPESRPESATPAEPAPPRVHLGGSETILLVEDEDSVRMVLQRMLSQLGYTVLTATHGEDALRLRSHYKGRLDLIISDLVMPMMSGPQLIERMRELGEPARVLFISGYAGDAILRRDGFPPGTEFIQKPFPLDALPRKVREILDAAKVA